MKTKSTIIFIICIILVNCKEGEKEVNLLSELNEEDILNTQFFRFLSDLWDAYLGDNFDKYGPRNFVHFLYHMGIGFIKYYNGNFNDAVNEWKRALQQFQKFVVNVEPLE